MHLMLFFTFVTAALLQRSVSQSLCDGCLLHQEICYNSNPGDCTKYVQCWTQKKSLMSLERSCPFGQFWDAGVITCRPSYLIQCKADLCKHSMSGFTYGMKEYGCRAYWKCVNGFSVGHCCPNGSGYVEGMGCQRDLNCMEECPPQETLTVRANATQQ